MKEFTIAYTISGIYNDNNNIYDLEKYQMGERVGSSLQPETSQIGGKRWEGVFLCMG